MRVTLADIAARTGLSKSTISIALRNDPRLPVATRERVQRLAKEMGYHPDPGLATIAALRWRRSGTFRGLVIACVMDSQAGAIKVRRDYVRAAQARAIALGYHAEVFDVRDYGSNERLSRVLWQRGVRGLIVPPIFDGAIWENFDWSRFAGIACGTAHWWPPFHVVNTDVFASVQLAIHELRGLGYHRIGAALLTHPMTLQDDARRIGAALFEIEQHPAVRVDIFKGEQNDQQGFVRWMRKVKPEAVLGLNESIHGWLTSAGYRVPEDVGVACLVNRRNQELAGVDPRHTLIGETAAELLDLEIHHNKFGPPAVPQTVLVPPAWNAGRTVRQVR